MKRKLAIVMAFMLILVMAAPAFAAVNLDINGKAYPLSSEPSLNNGITAMPLEEVSTALECSAAIVQGDIIRLQKNETTLQMTVGSTTAVLNEAEKTMPMAPSRVGDQVYIPLRFVAESLGATVAWNDQTQTVGITYQETRDGMTADELLARSNQAMTEAGRYKMAVDLKAKVNARMAGEGQAPESIESMQMDMDSHIDAWMQMDPLLMYMKQKTNVNAQGAPAPGPQVMETEMVLNTDGMFMTMPGVGWVKMDLEGMNFEDLMKQSMAEDPATAMKQMKDLGMSLSFANDQEKDGKKYWVIKVAMGSDVFKSDYLKQIPGMGSDEDLQKMLQNTDLDIDYSVWINQETLYMDIMDLDGTMSIKVDIPAAEGSPAGQMDMNMDMKAVYTLFDYGKTFDVPQITDARDFEEVIAEQMATAPTQP